MAKSKVTNISNGPRGAYLDGQLIMAEPGETIEADDFNEEWFSAGSIEGLSKAELRELMDSRGIAYETDDNKADLLRKIGEASGPAE